MAFADKIRFAEEPEGAPPDLVLDALRELRKVLYPDGNIGPFSAAVATPFLGCWRRLTNALQSAREDIQHPQPGRGLLALWLRIIARRAQAVHDAATKHGSLLECLTHDDDNLHWLISEGWHGGMNVRGWMARKPADLSLLLDAHAGPGERLRAVAKEWAERLRDAPQIPFPNSATPEEIEAWRPWDALHQSYVGQAAVLVYECINEGTVLSWPHEDTAVNEFLIANLSNPSAFLNRIYKHRVTPQRIYESIAEVGADGRSLEEAQREIESESIRPGERTLLKPWPDDLSGVTIELLGKTRDAAERTSYKIETGAFHLRHLLDCLDPCCSIRRSPDNSPAEIARLWRSWAMKLKESMLLDRPAEVVIALATASLPHTTIVLPSDYELVPPSVLPSEDGGFQPICPVYIRPGESASTGLHLARMTGSSPVHDIGRFTYSYPSAHEAISMAARHLVSQVNLSEEYAEQALRDHWHFQRFKAITDFWCEGLAEARAMISKEYALACEWLKSNHSQLQTCPAALPADASPELKPVGQSTLTPAVQRAYEGWLLVEKDLPGNATDRQAYDTLSELEHHLAENLPVFATWQRYVRDGRKAHGKQKNSPRHDRARGGSIVQQKDL